MNEVLRVDPYAEKHYRRGYVHANLHTAEDFRDRLLERVERGEPLTEELVQDVFEEIYLFHHTALRDWSCKENVDKRENPPDFLCWAHRRERRRVQHG